MGKFRVEIKIEALKDLKKHFKSGNQASIKKIETILKELEIHPYTGAGQPEQLKYDLQDYWSRRINKKDRMVYSVNENTVIVEVVSAIGHYYEK